MMKEGDLSRADGIDRLSTGITHENNGTPREIAAMIDAPLGAVEEALERLSEDLASVRSVEDGDEVRYYVRD